MGWFIFHLLFPCLTHVGFWGKLFVAPLVVFSLLDCQCIIKPHGINLFLCILAVLSNICLVLQLVFQRVVLPFGLLLIISLHLCNNFLSLLRAKMWFVVHFVDCFVVSALRFRPIHLHLDKVLILFGCLVTISLGLAHLVLLLFKWVDELIFFSLTQRFQSDQFIFITVQSSKRGLIDNSWLSVGRISTNVAQAVIVKGEGPLRPQEHRHVSVISLRNLLTI